LASLFIKRIAIKMKGSFISVFLLVEFIALVNGSALRAQVGRSQMSAREGRPPMSVTKNNFTSFTRKYTDRGKLWMARNKAYLHHPNANFADEYSPNSKAVELFEKRTIDSKFYINKDNPSICYSQRSSSPMHFKKNGQWITIDRRLSPKGQLIYEASYQEDPLGFDIKRKSSYITTPDGKTYFNDWKLYGGNGSNETLLATADWTHYTTGDDGIAIKNIFPGIDAEMKVSRGSIKTNFIVHANKFSTYKRLLFRDSFLNGHPGNFTFSNGLPGNGLTSSADFRVSAATIFHIKEGVMYQKENPSSTHQFIPYYLDHNKLTLAINSDFLNAQLRIGDVVIDPLVQDMGTLKKDDITGSHSNQDCSMDTACQYDFMVPAPPGAVLTDAMFSFEFTANAPCVGQDGAFSFTINGGCTSQKYQGADPGTGPENFPNQSIVLNNGASVASCFPSPVCGPQNIPFSFYFYRNCNGPDGCDGSCIGASKDLTITLVGRTFDSATLSASTQSVCAGAPVTLTARGYYGVPPYFFIWQGLLQFNGDSVIQVNPNANTTYSVQVSGACPGPGAGPITKSITVNVSKPATPAFTSNSPVCTGGQLILSAPPKPGTTYFIENPVAGLGGGQYASTAVFNNVTAAYSGTWIAVASDVNGCTSDTASTTVVINPTLTPTATITASATNICTGTQVTFTATAINAGNSPTYQWLLNGKKVGPNGPVYSSSSFVNNDAISCVVSASGPCVGTFDVSNVIVLIVNAVVTPTFDAIGPLCQNSTPPVLPPTSKEGITGTWNPASINTSAIGMPTYKFTPSTGSCATQASLKVAIVSNISPTFPTIAGSYCQNTTAPALPLTSKEGITGTWSPASINTSAPGTATYTFTPSAGSCAAPASLNITIVGSISPTFPTIANSYCQNTVAPALPATSKEGITGTWSPASINTSVPGTTTYTFTASTGNCATPASLNITIVGSISPTFPTIAGSYCQNTTAPALPPTSKEGITGTWSPASINTSAPGTATYTFTPSAGSCATPASLNITIVGSISPTFPTIAGSYCQNTIVPALPPTSKEGITGTWSPASINTSALGTATYTFTPSAGSCSTPVSLNVTIVSSLSPTFDAIGPLCQNAAPPALPPTSKEGITGTWSPANINTSAIGTATYTFTPSAGNCAIPTSLNVTIVGIVSPTFPTIANSYCQNTTAPALPPTSKEGIAGTWNPASINTSAIGTATYTFTPSAGSCSTPVSLNVTIVSSFTPIFDPIGPLCQNSTAPVLPPTSKEGISGTWNPASINTSAIGTTTYIFTQSSAGNCATPVSLNITIVGPILPTFPTIAGSYCQNTTAPVLSTTSQEGITGTWNPASINTSALGTATYTFTPSAGSCATPVSLNVTIVNSLSPTFDQIGPLCQNSAPPALPLTSKEGITGTWSPAIINTSALGTATYKFTPSSAGSCAIPASISITIVNTISPTFPTLADSYCLNDPAPALATTSKEGINGTWNPSSINTANVGRTVYTFTPTGSQCGVSAQIAIVVNPPPLLTMGPDVSIAEGASTTMNVSVTGNIVSYQWKPSTGLNNTAIKDPVASPSSTTTYTLVVIDDNNCETSGSTTITVSGRSKILVPNAFSPNGDGINDTWIITNLSVYPGATIDVFNRYGQPVFHSENANKAWDGTYNGKPLPVGTYYYIIDLKNNEKKTAGSVTIFK
jgi:gliding motility-associated-like protein